jgi:glycosyltransferase involved in cell wall biosynthesis
MSTLPKITIVTPSFKQVQYLEETIKSILEQDYPNLEWLVVDGGSPDGSVDLIRKYEKHFTWWVSEKDRNHPHALNKGYERATGDIFCFVNSDDTLDRGALHYVAKQFQDPTVNWVVGWAKYFNDDGEDWVYGAKPCAKDTDWFRHNPVPQISSFWRTEAFKKVGGFTEKYLWSFDFEYWMRLYFKANWRPKVVRRCLGSFRLQPNSKTCLRPDLFVTDDRGIREEYAIYLTPAQREFVERWRQHRDMQKQRNLVWQALKSKDTKSARKLAMKAVRENALSINNWWLMYATLRTTTANGNP